MTKHLLLAVQSLVTVGLMAWIFSQSEVRENTTIVLRNANLGWVFLAACVAGVETFLGACRWRIFLLVLGIRATFWETVRLYYMGLFFNTFLVGSVGGDAVKVLALIGRGESKSAALLSVVMDRLSGVGALVLVSLTFLLWQYAWLTQSAIVAGLIHFLLIYLGVVLLLLLLSLTAAWTGFGERAPQWVPFRKQLTRMCELYFLFVARWPRTLLAAGISCLMLLGYFLVFYCSMRAYGFAPELVQVFAFMPVVDVISAQPISLGGVGVREKLFTILLGDLFSVAPSTAVWISLTGFLMTLFWGLVGLSTLPFYRPLLQRGRELEPAETEHAI